MTHFIDINHISRLIKKIGLSAFIDQLSLTIEQDFKRWRDFEKSARLANHSDIGVIELMPTSDDLLYGFKYVNGHPANTAKGLSTVMAFGALSEVETGYPLLLSELTVTTAFRTAATSIMAARLLARNNSTSMAMIGCGAQSEFQAIAFYTLLGIDELTIFDVDNQAMIKLQNNLSNYPDLKVTACASIADAVKGVDIITTVTADKTRATILTAGMIEPGMHINALGGDCPGKTELHTEVLHGGKIFVEYEPQSRIEGDIQQLDKNYPVTEIWKVLTKSASGRDNMRQITIFDSVGFALEDFSALRYLYEKSTRFNIGEDILLVPDLYDPKDLFQLTLNGQVRSVRRNAA